MFKLDCLFLVVRVPFCFHKYARLVDENSQGMRIYLSSPRWRKKSTPWQHDVIQAPRVVFSGQAKQDGILLVTFLLLLKEK
jgi:hypothetical protein